MADTPAPKQQIVHEVQGLYFNGFSVGYGSSDVSIRLKLDNVIYSDLKCSYTTAKTLAGALARTIEKLEEATTHKLMTIDEVNIALADERNRVKSGLTKIETPDDGEPA